MVDVPAFSFDSGSKLFLPTEVLQGFGCKSCVWKSYGQCPHGYSGTELHRIVECVPCKVLLTDSVGLAHVGHSQLVTVGYCMELANFILSLGVSGDSISAIKEKFFIYTQELCALADGSDFHRLLNDIKLLKSQESVLDVVDYKSKLAKLDMEMLSSKIWWSRLTETVVKGLSRIADRESRSKDVKDVKQLTVQDLNIILQDSARVLLDDKCTNKTPIRD